MIPLSPWQAWWDIMPWDTLTDFREQVFNGFGIVRKFEKRRAERNHLGQTQGIEASSAAAAPSGAGGAGGATPAAGLA